MVHDHATGGWKLPLLLGAFLLASPSTEAEEKPIPRDLKIVAQYGSGMSRWKSWKCTITADGKVNQGVHHFNNTTRVAKLTEDEIRSLLGKIKAADFYILRKKYDVSITDQATLILNITLDRKDHRVVVYAPHMQSDNKEVRRFFLVWAEVLRKVPAPNPEQKPELYKP
jgi:hypothetical protein